MGADGSRKPFGLNEIVALIWFALDAGTHLSIERLYVLFTLVSGGAAYSKHPLAFIVSFSWRIAICHTAKRGCYTVMRPSTSLKLAVDGVRQGG